VQLETGGLLAALVQARIYLEMCETGPEKNRGVHRMSPRAQRFVYETWLRTMSGRNIDIAGLFGYDAALLSAVQEDIWFRNNSEPHPSDDYTPVNRLEEMMDRFCGIKLSNQAGV
jgi:hypothetical protein